MLHGMRPNVGGQKMCNCVRINDRDRKCSLVVGLIMVREKMLGVGSNMLRTETE